MSVAGDSTIRENIAATDEQKHLCRVDDIGQRTGAPIKSGFELTRLRSRDGSDAGHEEPPCPSNDRNSKSGNCIGLSTICVSEEGVDLPHSVGVDFSSNTLTMNMKHLEPQHAS